MLKKNLRLYVTPKTGHTTPSFDNLKATASDDISKDTPPSSLSETLRRP